MIGLFWKDLFVLRKQLSYYMAFLLVYGVLVVAGVMPVSVLGAMVVLLGMMLPMSSFAYDDLSRWDKYAAATPAGRQGIVAGKYFFAATAALAGSVLVLVLQLLLSATGLAEVSPIDAVFSIAACLCITLLLNAVILPLLIKFGAEKSRIISILLFVVVFGGIMLLAQVTDGGTALPQPPAWLLNALPVVLVLLAIGAYAVSYFVSLGLFSKKEL